MEAVRPPVRITSREPLKILSECRKAALKADVSLAWWTEFRDTAMQCLRPDCDPEEMALFMRVVSERFAVTE